MQTSESLYRSIAGQGASYIGLLLVVYDTLAADLRRAGQAVERAEIAPRCEATNHAFLLLGHLESWTESLEDPVLQASLRQFYSHIRSQAMLLQAKPRPEPFYELANLVGETRAAWHMRELTQLRSAANAVSAAVGPPPPRDEFDGPSRQSWSA